MYKKMRILHYYYNMKITNSMTMYRDNIDDTDLKLQMTLDIDMIRTIYLFH